MILERIGLHSRFRVLLAGATVAAIALNIVTFGLGAAIPIFDLLSSVAPAILIVSLVAGSAALIMRAGLIALGAFLGGAAAPAVVIGLELLAALRPPLPESANKLKVVTLNVLSANNTVAAESFILSERPDLLLLQEAARNDHPLFYETLETIYPTIIANYPHCSTAIATTLTLVEQTRSEECATTIARFRLPENLGGEDIMVASVHIPNARHGEAGPYADILRARMSAWPQAVVGGDFNATPWSWGLRRFDAARGFERWTRALPTWPTPIALLPIDQIFSTSDWQAMRVQRGPDLGSDHYPVIVELGRPSSGRDNR